LLPLFALTGPAGLRRYELPFLENSMNNDASTRPELSGAARWADETFARSVVPRRDIGAHKWGVGGVLVIAGSPAYTGAAWLTCRAAGRAGAGIVRLASGQSVIGRLASTLVEVGFVALPESDTAGAARRAVERMEPSLAKVKAVIVGPGLDDDESTDHLLSALFAFGDKASRPPGRMGFGVGTVPDSDHADGVAPLFLNNDLRVVVDADALKWLARQDDWWERVPEGRLILTPHPGEMAELAGVEAMEIVDNPQEAARTYASKWRQTVVVKSGYGAASDGTTTLVADDAPVSLATAGTGDVLAGTLGAFVAQELASVDAAGLAFFVGARAARTVEAMYGELGVIAQDLPDVVASELRQLTLDPVDVDTEGIFDE
jgi:NAD(P)H-hydrate repair Nnr-like enzyme with NAD(P)H-hydrate dehydratase domain